MSNLKIIEEKSDVKEVLSEVIGDSENIECVMVIYLTKDGNQHLKTSSANGYKKAYLVQFLNAWMNNWFSIGSEDI